jgi:Fic family protein
MEEFFRSESIKSPKNLEDIAKIHYDFVKIHPFMD